MVQYSSRYRALTFWPKRGDACCKIPDVFSASGLEFLCSHRGGIGTFWFNGSEIVVVVLNSFTLVAQSILLGISFPLICHTSMFRCQHKKSVLNNPNIRYLPTAVLQRNTHRSVGSHGQTNMLCPPYWDIVLLCIVVNRIQARRCRGRPPTHAHSIQGNANNGGIPSPAPSLRRLDKDSVRRLLPTEWRWY